MTDGMLLALGCGIFFIFLSGAYVYIRESSTLDNRAARPRGFQKEAASAVQVPGSRAR